MGPQFPKITKGENGLKYYEWPKFDNEEERVANFYACHPYLYRPICYPSDEVARLKSINANHREIDAAILALEKLKKTGMAV